MLITKAINNNVVLAEDDAGRELVLFGKGLGFRGAPSYIEDESSIQRSFRDISPEMYDAVASLSDDVIIIASGIVDIARNELNCTLNPNLVFTLADHLQFAIDRARKGASIKNPLYEEVRLVYPREAEVGRRGVKLVMAVAEDVDFPETEAASIALHIVNDEKKAQTEKLNQTEGVISVLVAAGQYQIVIGNHVTDVYDALPKVSNIQLGGEVEDEAGGSIVNRAIQLISGIFMPMLPAMSAAGLLKAFVIMANSFGWLAAESTTYQLLYAIGDGVFYFMPVFLARTAAKKFKCNDWTAMAIAVALCYPTLSTLFSAGDPVDLFGIPVTLISYTSSVIPIIFAVYAQSWIEKGLNKVVPDILKGLIVPVVTLVVATALTLYIIGPVTDFIGGLIANGLVSLLEVAPLPAGFLIGLLWPCLIIFGMHWAFIPIIQMNIGMLGYDVILPITVGTNFAMGFAVLAIFLKTKNTELKELAGAAAISALLAGITEPAIYGAVLKYKRPFVIAIVSCGICGAIAATFGLHQPALMTTSLITIPAIIGSVGMEDVIALAVASVLTFVGTLTFGFNDDMILENN